MKIEFKKLVKWFRGDLDSREREISPILRQSPFIELTCFRQET